ncbi:MAG TPA: energy transducer TonB, partial [Elusimicrobiota bacterium]|nr:energy transducer TonB [Elusimicrobiota bacterium]
MTRTRRLLGGFAFCVLLSAAVHAGAAGGLLYWLVWRQPAPIVAELDLTMSPLSVPNAGGGAARPAPAWTVPKKGKAPPPPPAPAIVPAAPPPAAPSVAPKPGAPVGNGDGGGGSGAGEGAYVPVSQTARKPRWIANFITSRDYPGVARQQGKDGRVVVSILLDAEGRVRDARLLQGSYDVLNEVALRKIRDAVFTPAYDSAGRPVPCKVALPIRFEL